jgi:hypothetical protein
MHSVLSALKTILANSLDSTPLRPSSGATRLLRNPEGEETGVAATSLVCYVKLQGPFSTDTISRPPSGSLLTLVSCTKAGSDDIMDLCEHILKS